LLYNVLEENILIINSLTIKILILSVIFQFHKSLIQYYPSEFITFYIKYLEQLKIKIFLIIDFYMDRSFRLKHLRGACPENFARRTDGYHVQDRRMLARNEKEVE